MTRSRKKATPLNNIVYTNYIDNDNVDGIVLKIMDIFNEKISIIIINN